SINELFIGVGYTSGPAIGGILYRVGGFHLPFTITGSILLAMIIPVFFLLPPEESFHNTSKNGNVRAKEDEEIGSLIQTLKVPGIFVISICIVSCGTILAFFDPTLTPYLLKIDPGITSEQIGLVFFMTSFLYVVGTPIVGAICDKKISGRHLMIIGHFTTALSYFLLGPSPLFQNFLKGSVLLVEISMCFIGFCAAFFCVPLLSDMQKSGKKSGLPQTIATDTLISGIFNGCFGIGCSIGPLLGSTLVDLWGFEWTATIMALIITVEGLVLFFFTIWEKKYYSKMQGYTKIAEEA
uniref:Major facilitator superfamily (MFS) profile domain-containing protein n=2 Tax=Clytia hemisphaerica TaxID=252671 RepID=A0A7M5XJ92_9CNID